MCRIYVINYLTCSLSVRCLRAVQMRHLGTRSQTGNATPHGPAVSTDNDTWQHSNHDRHYISVTHLLPSLRRPPSREHMYKSTNLSSTQPNKISLVSFFLFFYMLEIVVRLLCLHGNKISGIHWANFSRRVRDKHWFDVVINRRRIAWKPRALYHNKSWAIIRVLAIPGRNQRDGKEDVVVGWQLEDWCRRES